ncbi:MAG: inositol monophosphatase family protein [Pseudomonadota bacterium]
MALQSPTVTVMIATARKAGRALVRDFGEVENLQVSRKGPADFVSQADLKAERIIREELSRARPGFGLLLEESGEVPGDEAQRFIVDPLDGTTNFLHGIPHFAVSIALAKGNQLTAGVVYNPISDELYWAERGKGAYLNDRRLRASARTRMGDAIFATGIPFRGRPGHAVFKAELDALMDEVAGIRRFGAASLDLAYVAAGRFDGFWERGLAPWDIAAGAILVREARGVVTDAIGGGVILDRGDIVAANEALHRPLLDVVKRTAAAVAS